MLVSSRFLFQAASCVLDRHEPFLGKLQLDESPAGVFCFPDGEDVFAHFPAQDGLLGGFPRLLDGPGHRSDKEGDSPLPAIDLQDRQTGAGKRLGLARGQPPILRAPVHRIAVLLDRSGKGGDVAIKVVLSHDWLPFDLYRSLCGRYCPYGPHTLYAYRVNAVPMASHAHLAWVGCNRYSRATCYNWRALGLVWSDSIARHYRATLGQP